MFEKRPRLRPVRRYPMPGYPVIGDGQQVLFRPPDPRISSLARDLVKPAIPLALASFLAQPPEVAAQAGPATYFCASGVLMAQAVPSAQDEAPRRKIRRFSEKEVEALVKDLSIQPDPSLFVKGEVETSPGAGINEAQGRQILERFFRKNGLLFKNRSPFDAYDPDRKIGFEFLDPAGSEATKLDGRNELDQILVVKGDAYLEIPTSRDIVLKLQEAAEQYLTKLQKEGRIWKSADAIAKRLRSDDQADAAKAADELKKLGPDVLADLQLYASEKRVQDVIQAIIAAGVKPLLEDLDGDDPAKRDSATSRLIELSEAVKGYVEEERKRAEEQKRPEAAARCKQILEAIGD